MNLLKKTKTVVEYILDAIKKEGIDTIFLVPGGMIGPFLSSYSKNGIRPIVTAHEAGAAYMADNGIRKEKINIFFLFLHIKLLKIKFTKNV